MSSVVLGWGKGGVGNSTVSALLAARGYGVEIQGEHLVNPNVPVRIVVLTRLYELDSYKALCLADSPFIKADNVVFVINKCSEDGKNILEQQMGVLGLKVSAYLPNHWYLSRLSQGFGMGLALSKAGVKAFVDDLVAAVGGEHFSLP